LGLEIGIAYLAKLAIPCQSFFYMQVWKMQELPPFLAINLYKGEIGAIDRSYVNAGLHGHSASMV
jgi:hypothetical protein